jgi:hypothetical protein
VGTSRLSSPLPLPSAAGGRGDWINLNMELFKMMHETLILSFLWVWRYHKDAIRSLVTGEKVRRLTTMGGR